MNSYKPAKAGDRIIAKAIQNHHKALKVVQSHYLVS